MNYGHSIITDAISDLIAGTDDTNSSPLRPARRTKSARSHTRSPRSDSFADHPERW